MKKLVLLAVIALGVLLTGVGVVLAARPEPEPFTTTGYTTFYEPYPPVPLPSGHIKFHLKAQGGEEPPADEFCQVLAVQLGFPAGWITTCDALCQAVTGRNCGAAGYFDGQFAFEEWGIVDWNDPLQRGANYGLMTVTTAEGTADLLFGGVTANQIVTGSFLFLKGDGAYKQLNGQGTYFGSALPVFTVDYTPCGDGKKDDPQCPADRCAVFGDDLKVKKDKVEWRIANGGGRDLVISSILVNWPPANGGLTRVKLGGKTIYDQNSPAPWVKIETGWRGKDKDREVGQGKAEQLTLEFAADYRAAQPHEYTLLVEFEGGCAVPFVAFPPTP